MDLQAAFRRQQPYESGYFAGQMVDLVSILAGIVLPTQEAMIGKWFILEDFDTFATARIVFGCFRHAEQLSHLVLEGKKAKL